MFTKKSVFVFSAVTVVVFMLMGMVPIAQADSVVQSNTIVVPAGYNFPIAKNTGQDTIKGKPGIAFDGTNFLVPYAQGMDIYARRVTPQGVVLDTTSIAISVGLNESAFPPSVVFDGTNYFLAWAAMRAGTSELYGARVTPSGTVLDPGGVQITTGGDVKIRMPGLAFDGVNFLTVWRTNGDLIYAARVSTSIANIDAPSGFPIATTGASWYPAAAFDGTNYLVIWHDGRNYGVSGYDIYGARVTPQGSVLEPNGFVICNAPQNQDHSTVGFDGTNFLVAWYDWRPNNDNFFGSLYGARVAPNGTVLDTPPFQIADRARGQVAPSVVCGGDNCLVIWDTDYPNIGTKFRLSDAWGRRVGPDGAILDQQAIPVATAYGHQFGALASYGGGRYLVVWSESTGREWVGAIYGQILEQQAGSSPQSVFSSQQISASNPGDESWTIESAPITDHALTGIAFSPTDSWAFGGTDAFHYQNGSWQSEAVFPTAHIYGSWGSSPNDIWISGWCGAFSHFDGQSWTDKGCVAVGEGGHTTMGLWGMESNNIWGATNNGKLFHYNGPTGGVTPVDTGLPLDFSDIWGTSNNNIYAVGERGIIFRYDGTNWSQQAGIPSRQRLNAIWGSGPNNIYAVGDWGTILHFNGQVWSPMTSNTLQQLYDVWGWSETDVYAVGFGGTILYYNGTSWIPENSGTNMDLLSIWGAPGENNITIWASGSGQQILKKVKTWIFSDVPSSHWASTFIERLYNAGITGGCSLVPLMYCPEVNVTRAQMAVFLLRGEHGSAYVPPAVGIGTGFTDVPADHWAAAWIKQLAVEGITSGCGPSLYCPETSVTRDQMAVFLLRAEHGASYTPPPATGVFTDVPTTHWAAAWIEQLATEGITGGCGVDTYCPSTPVTRAQMAVFLVRTFNLP